jgi:hypothetical protein
MRCKKKAYIHTIGKLPVHVPNRNKSKNLAQEFCVFLKIYDMFLICSGIRSWCRDPREMFQLSACYLWTFTIKREYEIVTFIFLNTSFYNFNIDYKLVGAGIA